MREWLNKLIKLLKWIHTWKETKKKYLVFRLASIGAVSFKKYSPKHSTLCLKDATRWTMTRYVSATELGRPSESLLTSCGLWPGVDLWPRPTLTTTHTDKNRCRNLSQRADFHLNPFFFSPGFGNHGGFNGSDPYIEVFFSCLSGTCCQFSRRRIRPSV